MKELVNIYGSPINLYNRIKIAEKATTKSASVSLMLPDDRRFLINIKKLKSLCFDQLMEHSFTEAEIAIIIDMLKRNYIQCQTDSWQKLINKIINVIKLLKE